MFIEACWVQATVNSASSHGNAMASPRRTSIRSSSPLRRFSSAATSQNAAVDVDADELTPEVRGQRACRPADAAADVEHDVVGGDPSGGGEAECGRQSERVQMIDRREQIGGDVADIVSLGFDGVEDPRDHRRCRSSWE